MDYRIALFVHLLALMAASAAAALAHLAQARGSRAESLREIMQWHAFTGLVARVFPVATLALVATGAYMVARAGDFGWNAGWVQVGIAGSVILFASGAVLGRRHRAVGAQLAALQARGGGDAIHAIPDRVVATLSWMNVGTAIAVVFVMAQKPGLVGSIVALALGMAAGIMLGRASLRTASAAAPVAAG
jgi:hypothetical protein